MTAILLGSGREWSLPVVALETERFSALVGADREKILERLPYIGLDIESVEPDRIRVEYSPNRPDFGTDYGIAKALRGLLGLELGLRRYEVYPSNMTVSVDPKLSSVRPFIACATAGGLELDDEDIRQLISLQEDLHNGLGRRRKMVAIGLHDIGSLVPPIQFRAVDPSFSFLPLGETAQMRLDQILAETDTGKAFGRILAGSRYFPILNDSKGTVLSFPPVVNGNATRVTSSTKSMFIDVTSMEMAAGDEVLAIIMTTLADMGGKIGSVKIDYQEGARDTPDLGPSRVALDEGLINRVTGLRLSETQIADCLRKSRLDVSGRSVLIPRYRIDILHPVDIAEEVALGYGIDAIEAEYPPSKEPGSLNRLNQALDRVSESVAMAGFIETMNFDLVDVASLYTNFSRPPDFRIEVENPRTIEHSVLRDSILPSLMAALSRNVQATYPQKVYEVGRVFLRDGSTVVERPHLSALTAHSSSSFSEAKMYLEALVLAHLGESTKTLPGAHWAFAEGRCAEVLVKGQRIGYIGEVKPTALAAFGLDVPVAGYEIDLGPFIQN
jgi:phenylalanyl-tRNA synthetase beta chain